MEAVVFNRRPRGMGRGGGKGRGACYAVACVLPDQTRGREKAGFFLSSKEKARDLPGKTWSKFLVECIRLEGYAHHGRPCLTRR